MPHFITSLQHPLVKHLVKLREQRDYRYSQQTIVVEGLKPILELGPYIKKIIRTETAEPPSIDGPEEWIVTEAVMKKISGMTSPEGILAEAQMPPFSTLSGCRFILVLDAINDPGNMGALIRTALALGWDGIYLLPNCCDPFNEKVIRAARGAHFRFPLRMGDATELKALADELHLPIWAADLEGKIPEQASMKTGGLLVLGNEAQGVSDSVKQYCTKVTIPMPGPMESLNVAVAGGILMYLFRHS